MTASGHTPHTLSALSCTNAAQLDSEMFRLVQDVNPDGFMMFKSVRDESGKIIDFCWLYTNPAGEQFVGRSNGELRGKHLLEEMPGNRDEGLFDAYVQVVETGTPLQREFPYQHEGLSHWFRSKATRIGDGFAVVFADITQQKQDELKQRLRDQRLYLALQTAQMDSWDWVIDKDEFILSNYAAQLFGLSSHNIYSLNDILERIYVRDREHVKHAFEDARSNKNGIELECRIHAKHNPIWIVLRGTRYHNEQGQVRIAGIVRDVTERRNFEDRQQFQIDAGNVFAASLDYQTTIQQILHLIVPRIADWCCIHTLSDDGQVNLEGALHADPTLTQQLIQMRQVKGDMSDSCDVVKVLQTAQSIFYPTITPQQTDLVDCDKGDTSILQKLGCQSLICAPLIAHGEVIGTLSMAMAESGRKYVTQDWRMVDTLAHSMAVAIENSRLYSDTREAVRIREAFLSIAAHELRNPLTALLGQAQLMQRRLMRNPQSSEQDQHTLDIIVEQSNRLNKMISSLLDISRLERGEDQFDSYDIEICSFTQSIMNNVLPTLEKHRLLYAGEQGPLFIAGDMVRLEQVIQNLLTNAIKYTPSGGDIIISIQKEEQNVLLSVRDHGIGIPSSAIPNLFKQFYRASNASGSASGLGIGLYIVREIVLRHGGHITVESVEGQGSTFHVYLPLMQPQPDE